MVAIRIGPTGRNVLSPLDLTPFRLSEEQDTDDRQDDPAKKIDERVQDAEEEQADNDKKTVGLKA